MCTFSITHNFLLPHQPTNLTSLPLAVPCLQTSEALVVNQPAASTARGHLKNVPRDPRQPPPTSPPTIPTTASPETQATIQGATDLGATGPGVATKGLLTSAGDSSEHEARGKEVPEKNHLSARNQRPQRGLAFLKIHQARRVAESRPGAHPGFLW